MSAQVDRFVHDRLPPADQLPMFRYDRPELQLPDQLNLVEVLFDKAMSKGLGDKPYCAGIHLSLADIAVGCALGYLDFRFPEIDWRPGYPNLAKLQEKLMQRQSFIDSKPA